MSETSPNESPGIPVVPLDIVTGLEKELEVEMHQMVSCLPAARWAIETQWAEGKKHARFVLEPGDPINARLDKFAVTLSRWMNQDYDGMVKIAVRKGGSGNYIDDLVAVDNTALRQARLAAGAIDISASALGVALRHTRESKYQAIDSQDWETAATWRDQEKNVILALDGVGLAKPEE